MFHLEDIGPPVPRLPRHRWATAAQVAVSASAHVLAVLALVTLVKPLLVEADGTQPACAAAPQPTDTQDIVFVAHEPLREGGGGGGGGNRQAGPIRHAEGIGADKITLRTRKPAALTTDVIAPVEPLAGVVLDAKPLASGTSEQFGLPPVAFRRHIDRPGFRRGAGTNRTGGPGTGPGIGPGSGGGIGGGVYRPGGSVTAPRVIVEVKPTYSTEALANRIQGTVMLELVVTRAGTPSQIRVIRSLDPDGLDLQAVSAAARWRFEPGRLAGTPVDVLVIIVLDFSIR